MTDVCLQVENAHVHWIHFRKLPSKGDIMTKLKNQLFDTCCRFGIVESVVIMYGRGQGLVKLIANDVNIRELFSSIEFDEVDNEYRIQLDDWKHPAIVQLGSKNHMKSSWDISDSEIIRKEVTRRLDHMIRHIVTEDSNDRMRQRRILKKKHSKYLNDVESSRYSVHEKGYQHYDRANICWYYIQTGGRHKCPIELNCSHKLHMIRPIRELPNQMRAFIAEDDFPTSRELSPFKHEINLYLTSISSALSNKKCLVLDGAMCLTTKALLSCQYQKRSNEDITVPNYCTNTFDKIQASNLCVSYFGSLRCYLEDHVLTGVSFGLIYLDYCCRLSAGYKYVEKSPLCDLDLIFAHSFLSSCSGNCILAICLCRDSSSIDEDTQLLVDHDSNVDNDVNESKVNGISCRQYLDDYINNLCDKYHYTVSKPYQSFEYGVVFVEIYAIS